jgi:hypothetical protein
MKKLLTILMTVSLAAGAMAQQEEASPSKKKRPKGEKPAAQEAQPSQNQARPARESRPGSGARPTQERKATRRQRAEATAPAQTKAPSESATEQAPATSAREKKANATGTRHNKQNKKEQTDASAAAAAHKPAKPADASVTAETSASTTANPPAGKRNAKAKKPDPQVVQKVKTEHANFKAQPKPEKVPAVTFNKSYRINGAQQWQGSQYEVFRTYRPQWRDEGWYRSHYTRVEIIAGGAYYFSNGYWYPAWGYNPSYQYYAYDAPIYVGSRAEPPDRVIANVQAILQEQGYYKGEVDGLLGPLTREALTGYQADNGLYTTATIDEPTLASLGLS